MQMTYLSLVGICICLNPLVLDRVVTKPTCTGRTSAKADVYSFGVVLLELLTGGHPYDKPNVKQNLVHWSRPCLADKGAISYNGLQAGRAVSQGSSACSNKHCIAVHFCPGLGPLCLQVLTTLKQIQVPKNACIESTSQTEHL